MFAIDLEKELRKQSTDKDNSELLLREAENILNNSSLEDRNILKAVGLDTNIKKANKISKGQKDFEDFTFDLDKSRIFSKEQIKGICVKYKLRFLYFSYYRGNVDPSLPSEIRNYCEKTGSCISELKFKICAPKGSFELKSVPKDPLAFVRILDTDKYYLLKKWGNDVSWFRRINGFFASYNVFSFWFVFSLVLGFYLGNIIDIEGGAGILVALSFLASVVFFALWIIGLCGGLGGFQENNWDSEFE